MNEITLKLTDAEASMLVRGYLEGIPGGAVGTHQTLSAKLERLRVSVATHRANIATKAVTNGSQASVV